MLTELHPAAIRFGRFEIQPFERRLLVDGTPAVLGARAFDVLIALAERAGRLVTKNDLLDRVWSNVVVEENNLQVQVSQLRKLLGPDVIATIPGRGYRFTGRVEAQNAAAMPDTAVVRDVAVLKADQSKLKTNLPERLPALIGRDDELAALGALIGKHPLVTIVGAGGIGKTRLAQALLQGAIGNYEHGVCFVELASVTDAASVPSVIGAALGVNIGLRGEPLSALIGALAPLSMLIAIDNAEHLVEALAPCVAALIDGAPKVRLIVTSQVPLRLADERVYRLGALSVPEERTTAREALSYGAVALFAERAQAVDRRFVLNDANVGDVIELCDRLDGLALAIELAAARAPLLGLPALISALDERLQVLTTGNRMAPARQKTLRAALEWSHSLLDEAEQTVFRRLAVFVESASLEAARTVLADEASGELDEWAVLDALGLLVDRSLVEVIVEPGDHRSSPRYRLLETSLAYALERLKAAGEERVVRRRHALAMRALFQRANDERLSGRIGIDASQQALRPDLRNARAAVEWAITHEPALALEIAAPLGESMGRDLYREGIALWEAVEPILQRPASRAIPPELLGTAMLCSAFQCKSTRPNLTLTKARQALALLGEYGNRITRYRAFAQIAGTSALIGNAVDAEAALREMRALADPAWPPIVRMFGANAEYVVLHFGGHSDEAMDWLNAVVALEHAAGLVGGPAMGNLADTALAAGRVDEAVRLGRSLVDTFAGTRYQFNLIMARANLTQALLAQGAIEEAGALARAGWPQARWFGVPACWPPALALLAALEGRADAALRLIGYCETVYALAQAPVQINERRSLDRAERLARAALASTHDDAACARLKAQGALLRDENVAELAFGQTEAVPSIGCNSR